MHRLLALPVLLALVLAGCSRSDSKATADAPDTTTQPDPNDATAASQPPAAFTPRTGSLVSPEQVPLLEQINRENVKVLAAAMPTIVRITASKPVDPHLLFGNSAPFHVAPALPHGFMGNDTSYGSGVIVSADGYIVTNNHVIEDAKDVQVELQNKRTYTARIVASDAPLDLAVLKIDATNLTALPWGNSDKVQVGEQVFAIGNPFNLEDSASKGIVSATRRTLPDVEEAPQYEDFIQTDAAMNPGNSGGALIDIHGEFIGLNAAIASYSRGSEGVGFSIPSNLVRYAVEGLIKNGHLVRGYLGVQLPNSVDEGVTQQLGVASFRGALVAGILPSSPADKAKLRPVDFITEVDGHPIDGLAHLRLVVAQIPVGKEVRVNYIRNGTEQSTTLKIGEVPKDMDEGFPKPAPNAPPAPALVDSEEHLGHDDNVLAGIRVANLDDQGRAKYGIDDLVVNGVVVTGVQEGSMADAHGVLPGDVIEVVSTRRASIETVPNAQAFADLTKNLKSSQSVVLLLHHGKSSGFDGDSSSFVYLAPQN